MWCGGGEGAALQSIVSWQADIAVLIGASDHWITEILSPVGSSPLLSSPLLSSRYKSLTEN